MTGTTGTTGRPALAGHANYRGDISGGVVGQVMGPNGFGERVTAVTAVFDPVANRTRVGFAYATVDEVAAADGDVG